MGLIEFTGGFIITHDDFDLPAFIIDLIGSFRRKVQVALKDYGAERLLLFPEGFQAVGLVLFCAAEPVPFLLARFRTVAEGIQPFVRTGTL